MSSRVNDEGMDGRLDRIILSNKMERGALPTAYDRRQNENNKRRGMFWGRANLLTGTRKTFSRGADPARRPAE